LKLNNYLLYLGKQSVLSLLVGFTPKALFPSCKIECLALWTYPITLFHPSSKSSHSSITTHYRARWFPWSTTRKTHVTPCKIMRITGIAHPIVRLHILWWGSSWVGALVVTGSHVGLIFWSSTTKTHIPAGEIVFLAFITSPITS